MVSLTEVLEVNWVILYFIYGQVFFIMGLVTGLQWRRQSQPVFLMSIAVHVLLAKRATPTPKAKSSVYASHRPPSYSRGGELHSSA